MPVEKGGFMETKPFLLGILLGGLILAGCSPVTTTSSSPDESSSTSSGSALSSESGSSSSISSSSGSSSQADYETKTVAELIALAAEHTDSASEERYYVRATVDEVSDPKNGGMTISDDTGSIEVFRTYSSDGKTSYGDLEEKPVAGDEVVLYGNLQTYKGTAEIYINGRKMRNASELDQLSSDNVKRVEVVRNPGARYDATVKAVVRIYTKKAQGEGFGFDNRFSTYYKYGWMVLMDGTRSV